MESGSCQAEGWHNHYYCRLCKMNFNPFGWWKKPKEEDSCNCNEDEMNAMLAMNRVNPSNDDPEDPIETYTLINDESESEEPLEITKSPLKPEEPEIIEIDSGEES